MSERKGGKRAARLNPDAAVVLERTTLNQLRAEKEVGEAACRFHWNFYSELAFQRKQIFPQLKEALANAAVRPYEFQNWQRAVRYRYSLTPLSAVGSLKFDGGRFNIGDIDQANFPIFPALYLARDRDTAMAELLGQPGRSNSGLTGLELALATKKSFSAVSVSGYLEAVIDLRDRRSVKPFVDLIKHFKVTPELQREAKGLGMNKISLVRTPTEMLRSILSPDWRHFPAKYDVPATSQLFGQMVSMAGVEGILYPSKLNGLDCLAVFPRLFANSDNWIQLDDDAPLGAVRRVDSSNWQTCEASADETETKGVPPVSTPN